MAQYIEDEIALFKISGRMEANNWWQLERNDVLGHFSADRGSVPSVTYVTFRNGQTKLLFMIGMYLMDVFD